MSCICAVPPKCFAQCVPGKYENFECIHDCIKKRYDYGGCVPNFKGKCCCTTDDKNNVLPIVGDLSN